MLKLKFLLIISIVGLINAISYDKAEKTEVHRTTRHDSLKSSEFFYHLITPGLFNWTESFSIHDQFRYRAMLKSKATLPSWLTYQPIIKDQVHSIYPNIHAKFHKEFLEINRTRIRSSISGFIYGTPPLSYAQKTFEIEVVGVNKKTYETRVAIIKFKVSKNLEPVNRVELKIANMNWYEVIETKEDLKRVFTDGLWNESRRDLTMTFMQSAVKMGSRYPIKPHSHEGVVVVFGSNAPLSDILIELKDEIEPLKKLSTCTYKKSKHQMKFETIKKTKLIIDWCAVKILNENDRTPSVESKIEEASFVSQKIWIAPTKEELPERNYSEEIAVSIAIPSVVLAFLVALLTIVLCFQHEELNEDESQRYFDDLFTLCNPKRGESDEPKSTHPVQMVQYSGTSKTPPVTALKSLHDPYDDNLSLSSSSHSPTSGIFRGSLTKLNAPTYLRPNPPAYRAPKLGESSGMMFHHGEF